MKISASYFAFLIAVASLSTQTATAADDTQATRARWQREDIAAFREKFLNVDRSFTAATKAAAQQRLSQLEAARGSIEPTAFAVELCRIAVLADNAHTQCLTNEGGRGFCKLLAGAFAEGSIWCDQSELISKSPISIASRSLSIRSERIST